MKKDLQFAFWGTPEVASETLAMLLGNGYVPKVVITNPDRPQGRGLTLTKSPVKILAEENNIPVLTPEKIDSDFTLLLTTYPILLNIVVAYGKILPLEVIDLPKHGTLNIHYSLLPKYRGASPVESALLNGDVETGVTIQKMVSKLDAGHMLMQEVIPIDPQIMREELRHILIASGAHLLMNTLEDYMGGRLVPVEQDESKATHCGKIKKENGLVTLSYSPQTLWNKYRAYENWPGIYFMKDGKRVKITKARYENEKFIIEKVIPEGKKERNFEN